mgnify:CR=1 FL=1
MTNPALEGASNNNEYYLDLTNDLVEFKPFLINWNPRTADDCARATRGKLERDCAGTVL